MTKQCAKKCSEEGLVCNPTSGRCVDPNGAIGRTLKSVAPPAEAAREIKKTLKSIREFNELYAEEHAGLEHNIKNGHKRGVLSRLFHSAKNSITGLLTLIRKYPKYAMVLIAVLVYGAAAVKRGKLPGIDTASLGWVSKEVGKDTLNTKTYVQTMTAFVGQLRELPATVGGYISTATSALITAIVMGWDKVKVYIAKATSGRSESKPKESTPTITSTPSMAATSTPAAVTSLKDKDSPSWVSRMWGKKATATPVKTTLQEQAIVENSLPYNSPSRNHPHFGLDVKNIPVETHTGPALNSIEAHNLAAKHDAEVFIKKHGWLGPLSPDPRTMSENEFERFFPHAGQQDVYMTMTQAHALQNAKRYRQWYEQQEMQHGDRKWWQESRNGLTPDGYNTLLRGFGHKI